MLYVLTTILEILDTFVLLQEEQIRLFPYLKKKHKTNIQRDMIISKFKHCTKNI